MYTQKDIQEFLAKKEVAVAGISRDEKKFSRLILKKLIEEGFTIHPVNPNAPQIGDLRCYSSVSSLPAGVEQLIILTNKKESLAVLQQALDHGIKKIWIQQGCDTPEVLSLAQSSNLKIITGECLFMWLRPVGGIHKFHHFIRKVFSGLPAQE